MDAREAVGIALVAALPTTPQRRGRDRIHVALHAKPRGVLWSLELAKDAHTRESAETIADEMVFRALAELSDLSTSDSFFESRGLSLARIPFDA
jgi:membrane carboxypeptidase/penicillin-binding protein PbpC